MNCRAIEPLLLTERDGVLTDDQHTTLERHVAACPSCLQLRVRLTEAMDAFRDDAVHAAIPDIEAEWRTLHAQLSGELTAPLKNRPLAPVIWISLSLAAAAALALAYLGSRPKHSETVVATTDIAQAEYVEAGNPAALTVVYVDKDSGWLVVWASDSDTKAKS